MGVVGMVAIAGALRWLNVAAYVATIAINALATIGLIGGVSTGFISDLYSTLVTPAGYVFSVWGAVYFLLGVFVVYQALPSSKEKRFHGRIGPLFALSCIWNIAWIFLWQSRLIALSLLPMFGLLITLDAIYMRLGISWSSAPLGERLAVSTPFSFYLGWITMAAIANVAAALQAMGWVPWGVSPQTWAFLVLALALGITLFTVVSRGDVVFGAVVVWALVGIAVKQGGDATVSLAAGIGAAAVALAMIVIFSSPRFRS